MPGGEGRGSICPTSGKQDAKPASEDDEPSEMDEVHRWNDEMVDPDKKGSVDYLFLKTPPAVQLEKRNVTITFAVDRKKYEDALKHPDLNHGVVLMSGGGMRPDLYCWLRPFQFAGDKALFVVTVPREGLEKMFFGFMPLEGKKRFLCNLARVVDAASVREKK